MFYMIRCCCPWRYLLKDFPPFTTVQNRFYAWRDSGLWAQIVAVFVMGAREAEGREAAPTAVVVDSLSVKTTESGGPRGFDAGKKVKGRKRHLAVDTLGLPIECQITVASVQDRDALAPLLKAVRNSSPWVKMSFVDGGYQGDEATLGWINRARRLSKDFEATIESALAWLQMALAFLIMRRLARAKIAAD